MLTRDRIVEIIYQREYPLGFPWRHHPEVKESVEQLAGAILAEMEEPLAVVADKKGTWPQITHNKTKWVVDIFPTNSEGEDESGECSMFYACVDTYAAAESAARAYLAGLPNVERGGK